MFSLLECNCNSPYWAYGQLAHVHCNPSLLGYIMKVTPDIRACGVSTWYQANHDPVFFLLPVRSRSEVVRHRTTRCRVSARPRPTRRPEFAHDSFAHPCRSRFVRSPASQHRSPAALAYPRAALRWPPRTHPLAPPPSQATARPTASSAAFSCSIGRRLQTPPPLPHDSTRDAQATHP